jgi:hypothetical protein
LRATRCPAPAAAASVMPVISLELKGVPVRSARLLASANNSVRVDIFTPKVQIVYRIDTTSRRFLSH